MDFTRPDITEEELNSEVELLRDEDLLKQVVKMAALVPADTPALERPAETERAARKLSRRLDVDALKKSNLIQVSYKDTSPERAARILSALSVLYMQRHTNLQRPPGVIQFLSLIHIFRRGTPSALPAFEIGHCGGKFHVFARL